MIAFWIILAVIIISAITGISAMARDLFRSDYSHKSVGLYEKFIKRGLDAFLATGALLILSPVLLVTAVLVRVKLGSPVLFTQERPGRNEEIFKLYKFRTMTDARYPNGELLPNDQRMTPFGNKLRATSLDELPELFNIVSGDMAVVGPRPLLVRYLPYYSPEERKRHHVRPGLTGLAQVTNDGNLDWNEKLKIDVKYAENVTFKNDVKIVINTIKTVFVREDTHNDGFLPLDEERKEKLHHDGMQ